MASHDAGWDTFRDELRHWMELRRYTSRALAQALNAALGLSGDAALDEHVVKRWRHSTAPPLGAVRHIASILEMSDDPTGASPHDPAFILRRMGMLDSSAPDGELIDSAHRLQELRLRLLDVRASLSENSARRGAGQLVQQALSHGYAAAVFPVWEGPVGYPMHVADRIDFRATRPGQPSINESATMRAAFIENFAVPGERMPRFSTAKEDLESQEHWAIQLIGRPSTRNGQALHLAAQTIAVSSGTTSAWPDDVGAILAWLLGYGFVTTREIARELTNNPLATEALRNDVHHQFLTQPPARHVWSHHAVALPEANPFSPWLGADGVAPPGLLHVRLVETDEVFENTAQWLAQTMRAPGDDPVALARAARATSLERLESPALDAARPRIVTVPVEHFDDASDRWEQVLTTVLTVTRALHDLGLTADLTSIHDRLMRDEPDIAPNLLRWLADHGCPLVSVKFSSSSHAM